MYGVCIFFLAVIWATCINVKIFSEPDYSVQHTRDNSAVIRYLILFSQSRADKFSLSSASLAVLITWDNFVSQSWGMWRVGFKTQWSCLWSEGHILKLLDSVPELNLSSVIIKWKCSSLLIKVVKHSGASPWLIHINRSPLIRDYLDQFGGIQSINELWKRRISLGDKAVKWAGGKNWAVAR